MATALFPKWGSCLFYLCIAVYLYGDLSIYASAMAKSLGDVIWLVERSFCIDFRITQTDLTSNLTNLATDFFSFQYLRTECNYVLR